MNTIQRAALTLIQEDARFLYAITDIYQYATNINSNYICMSTPYIGLFAEGSEQWCRKVGLNAPAFTPAEKAYYVQLRQAHKLFGLNYDDFVALHNKKFLESDEYFYSIRRLREKILGYYNIGTDLCENEYCGNTILCAMYSPINTLGNDKAGPWVRDMSCVAGKLASYFGCLDFPVYKYNDNLDVRYEDYHFYKYSPLRKKDNLGILLFSILCSINYVIEFIDNYFIEEIPQKLKYAYIQYYYLCDFIKELNIKNNINLNLNTQLYDRNFRNCLAHYGLGQYMKEADIIIDDPLKGLTNKAFKMNYFDTKKILYEILKKLVIQIKSEIF